MAQSVRAEHHVLQTWPVALAAAAAAVVAAELVGVGAGCAGCAGGEDVGDAVGPLALVAANLMVAVGVVAAAAQVAEVAHGRLQLV